MRQKRKLSSKHPGTWIITALLIISFAMVKPEQASATTKSVQPFKTLKIGSYNVKNLVNREFYMYTESFDGLIEYYMKDEFPNRSQTGKRFRIKLKKGYKMKAYLCYTNSKGQQKKQRLKNNTKLKKWTTGGGEFIHVIVWKGKYTGYLNFANERFYGDEDDEDDEDDF